MKLRREGPFEPPEGSYLLGIGEQQHVRVLQNVWLTPELARGGHVFVLGQTGSGKTKFLESLIRQLLISKQGFFLIDLHGDLAIELRAYVATLPAGPRDAALSRMLWVDLADPDRVVTFNPLRAESEHEAATVRLELLAAFARHWSDFWGPRLADLMAHSLAVLQPHGLTLAEVPLLLGDKQARAELVSAAAVPQTARDYFTYRFDALSRRDQVFISESTLNKISALMSDYRVRTFLGASRGTLRPKQAMAQGKVVICRIPRGALVENANVVAALLLAAVHTAALSRQEIAPSARRPYTLILDEGQVASDSFVQLLAGARAYRLNAVVGTQFLDGLPKQLAESLLANCRVRVCFALSRKDAERLAREMFRIDADRMKHVDTDILGSRKSRPMYWSAQEEFEYACRELMDQRPGEFVAQLDRSLPWYAETPTVEPARPSKTDLAKTCRRLGRAATSRKLVERELAARRAALTHQPLTHPKGGAYEDTDDDAVEQIA